MKFAVVADPVFLKHVPPAGHPERPDRLRAILRALDEHPEGEKILRVEPTRCDPSWIERVHSRRHIENVAATAGRDFSQLDGDTFAGPGSHETALLAAGSCVDLTERLLKGEIDSGFALVRPPGHHAESGRAMGFCFYNNVAVAAARALRWPGIEKVAVVDYDVHHGNGTQEIFYGQPRALYVSLHQHPLYPGGGDFSETGAGEGVGTTLNFPIPPGQGNEFYVTLLDDLALPALRRFKPDLLLASAGFDAHRDDPLAHMMLDAEGYRAIAVRLNAAARELCGGRVMYVLEGGYNLAALAESVTATLDACLQGAAATAQPASPPPGYHAYRRQAVARLGTDWGFERDRQD